VNCLNTRFWLYSHLTTKSMDWAGFCKADCRSNVHYSLLIWNPKVHHCVHKIPHLDPVMSQLNPIRNLWPCFFNIRFNTTGLYSYKLLSLRLFHLLRFISKTLHISHLPVHATYCSHLLHDLNTVVIWSSSLCNFLYPPVTFSFLDLSILISTLFSNTFRIWETRFHTHIKH
jgi:hypothetical protein